MQQAATPRGCSPAWGGDHRPARNRPTPDAAPSQRQANKGPARRVIRTAAVGSAPIRPMGRMGMRRILDLDREGTRRLNWFGKSRIASTRPFGISMMNGGMASWNRFWRIYEAWTNRIASASRHCRVQCSCSLHRTFRQADFNSTPRDDCRRSRTSTRGGAPNTASR